MASTDDNPADKEGAKLPLRPAVVPLKTPKGTRDLFGASLVLREQIFQTMTDVFRRHGGMPLDTPVFELRDILAGKYGEDSKLIYDLKDQGGEDCSLRYDLTVPFARWLAMNTNFQQVKRYHIAKVYRRDQPAMARGRYREFYQCDFDIAGQYDAMIPDAEILALVVEVMEALRLDMTIKINHRKVLDGMFAVCGVPSDKTRPISSAVDKLDKLPWAEVKKEMVEEKGLPEDVADRIGHYVKHSGRLAHVVELLRADETLQANADVQAGVDDMALLTTYTDALAVSDRISFDLSLARGLDYYTGVIYEVVLNPPEPGLDDDAAKPPEAKKKAKGEDVHVGSIAAGGRYDGLVGMYGKKTIPCVGVSFGVDRMFGLLEARQAAAAAAAGGRRRESPVDVYVMAAGGGKDFDGLLPERMRVARELWAAGIRAEFQAKVKAKLLQQFKAAGDTPVGVILGQDEMAKGEVRVRLLNQGKEGEAKDEGRLVKREDLVSEIKKLLAEVGA